MLRWLWTYRLVIGFAVFGFLLLGGLLFLYATDNHLNVHAPQGAERWGQFGDFVGGVLNPVFSLLAFLGLLYTIGQQHAQQQMLARQLRLDLLKGLLETRALAVDQALSERLVDRWEVRTGQLLEPGNTTLKELLRCLAPASRVPAKNHTYTAELSDLTETSRHEWSFADDRLQKTYNALVPSLIHLRYDLVYLSDTVARWVEEGGEPAVSAYYVEKYRLFVQAIVRWGFEDQTRVLSEFLRPTQVREMG